MPAHNQHVVISTGQRDWPSRIEDGGRRALIGNLPLARHLKSQLGPKGNWHDVSGAIERYPKLWTILM